MLSVYMVAKIFGVVVGTVGPIQADAYDICVEHAAKAHQWAVEGLSENGGVVTHPSGALIRISDVEFVCVLSEHRPMNGDLGW